jgi:hypothetical protein
MFAASQFTEGSELYPINNYFKSYPLTWDPNLSSHEIDLIYSASNGMKATTYPCIICNSTNTKVSHNHNYRLYNTFDRIDRIYYKNICKDCDIEWYNVDISYCTDCTGYLINFECNHPLCKCIFSDRERAMKVKGKKCIVFGDKELIIHEIDTISEYVKKYLENKLDNKEVKKEEIKPSGGVEYNIDYKDEKDYLFAPGDCQLVESLKKSTIIVKPKKKWWTCFLF